MIEKIGIIGAGAMGSSIAEVFAYNGYSVYLKDQNADYVNEIIFEFSKMERIVEKNGTEYFAAVPKKVERIAGLFKDIIPMG